MKYNSVLKVHIPYTLLAGAPDHPPEPLTEAAVADVFGGPADPGVAREESIAELDRELQAEMQSAAPDWDKVPPGPPASPNSASRLCVLPLLRVSLVIIHFL